jgi:hypothetical protein
MTREYRRFADRDRDFPRKDEHGNKVCRFCREPIAKGIYCSEACHIETDVRCGWNHEYHIRQRDHGICADCGIDTGELDAALWALSRKAKHFHRMGLFDSVARQCGFFGGEQTTEQFHHIKAVKDGGGCCGLENYVTLCVKCHKKRHARKAVSDGGSCQDRGEQRRGKTDC